MANDNPIEVHTADIHVEFSQFTVFDIFGDTTYADLAIPSDPDWLVSSGPGGALFQTSGRTLSAHVTLEIWTHPPQPGNHPAHPVHAFTNTSGRLMIACITAAPGDTVITLPAPGAYNLRAQRTHTCNIAEPGDHDMFEEHWSIQIWPNQKQIENTNRITRDPHPS